MYYYSLSAPRKATAMDETFLININCSSILFDSQEALYTMFIDTSKISIVYELVEWIRWIYSVESCIYLAHENSVIHELEDIRVLSKLKTFEIKLCGQPLCIHKKTYRTLLNSLKLFVNWNETKVHKYFFEKVNQIDQKLEKEMRNSDNFKVSEQHHTLKENECVQDDSNTLSPKISCNNQILSSHMLFTKGDLIDDSKSESISVGNSPVKKHCFDTKRNIDNFYIQIDESKSFNGVSQNTNNCDYLSPVKSPMKNKLETKYKTKKNSHKTSQKFVKPFSLGEILSNIREDIEKQKSLIEEGKKNKSEENLDEITTSDNLFVTKTVEAKKRQRTRKRKKSRKDVVAVERLISPVSESNAVTKSINFNHSFKPNHIRFDDEAENDQMEAEYVENELGVKNNQEGDQKINDSYKMVVETETPEVTNIIYENFSNQSAVSHEDHIVGFEEKIIDLSMGGGSDNIISSNNSESLSPDIRLLQSLKDKFKNAVVVNRCP